jgi:hypothetical protein
MSVIDTVTKGESVTANASVLASTAKLAGQLAKTHASILQDGS